LDPHWHNDARTLLSLNGNLDVLCEGGTVFLQQRKFRSEWVDLISTIILTEFDARSWDFLKNNTKWQEHSEEQTISKTS
jgi:hypothetical protein